jgi:arylsulfatase A
MNHPNIVYIMADDMGYGDPGCYGATKIPTPHMDKIATQGAQFTDAHSSAAVCTPSRYSVVTGRYCWRTPLKKSVLGGFGVPLIDPGRMTVASLLKKHNYATAAIGKWHLGFRWRTKDGQEPADKTGDLRAWLYHGFDVDYTLPLREGPIDHGFDYYFGISGSLDMGPYCFIENDHTVGIPDHEKEHYYNQQDDGLTVTGWREEEVDTTFAKKAVEFIEAHTQESPDKPFFLYLTPASPHRPCEVQPDFVKGKSQAGDRGDMVVLFDWVVGEVTGALDRLGLAENTLLIVTSDNGGELYCANGEDYGHKSNADWRGQKSDIWDGGHREPFLARWPGHIEPGSTCDKTICLGDLLATCADLVGEELPDDAGEDSYSFLSALTNKHGNKEQREVIVHHSLHGMFSVRKGNWKLVQGMGSGGKSEPKQYEPGPNEPQGQLYDMEQDPAETNNLWESRPDIVTSLLALLEKYREEGRSRP